jgi:predicted TIM-barrel fold metal-dependent hydrolase
MVNGYSITDMQHHYIPIEALKFLGKTPEHDFTTGLKRYRRAYDMMVNVDAHLQYMDQAGVDVSIVSTGAFSPNGHEFCRACNDGYAELVKRYPDRFKGTIQIYPLDGAKNLDEIKRSAEELGLWGLALATSYGTNTIDSSVMDPLWEAAVTYGMPVYIHPTVRINLWGGERYDLYTTMAREYDISKAFVEMLYGVLPRFPELKVIMAHFGGGLTALKGRLLAWHQPEGVPIPEEDLRHGLSIRQTKELGLFDDFEAKTRNFLFDSAGYGGWMPVIKASFDALGPDHICFGSDFPYELNKGKYAKGVIEDVCSLDLPQEDKRKFLEGNVERFFSR